MTLTADNAAEAAAIIAEAAGDGRTLEIVAGGSKRALGRPVRAADTLDVSRLAGVVDYAPTELVLTARPATRMAEVFALLDGQRQMLAFEPPDWRGLLGGGGEPTLGGVLACNVAGPRRVRAGAARDHFLGFSAVNGFGDMWKAGGRVVKNVTGYDMCKLQAGSYGTLSVLTEVSVKVLPRPETSSTLVLAGLGDEAAIGTMSRALNTPYEVSAAAHLPAHAARLAGFGDGAVTALRLEGPRPSVVARAESLRKVVGDGVLLDETDSATLWGTVGAVSPLLPPGRVIWRVCPTPSSAATVARVIGARLSTEALYDWGGGLLWLAIDDAGPDGGAAIVRAAVRANGGHATLFVAPDALRETVPVFEPEQPALAALSARVKAGFDPAGVLNPGRMTAGV